MDNMSLKTKSEEEEEEKKCRLAKVFEKYIDLIFEPAKILQKRKVNIACVRETRWAGSKARNVDGYKLWYSGVVRGKNGVGILVDRDLRESVVEVKRVNDRLMFIKLVISECTFNVVSAYAPQTGLDEEVKWRFLLEGILMVILGQLLVVMARCMAALALGIGMDEREEHLVTFQSSAVKTQIDYLLLRRYDRGLCKDCKVIPGETLATQHGLLVMDVGIMMKRKKRYARDRPRIRWGALTKDKT
ncbi:uncharacterized protein [Nicotiana sylvestris]|uniref:uncharacterized protein n=1 Tax=Nicotiana sylvestris TaxID=4096 RepID=UPI00388CBE34